MLSNAKSVIQLENPQFQPENIISNKKNVLSNAETFIQCENVLSNVKTCYPTRKFAIQRKKRVIQGKKL